MRVRSAKEADEEGRQSRVVGRMCVCVCGNEQVVLTVLSGDEW